MATYKQIGYGSKGSDVTEVQKLLNSKGYTLDTDGIFGDKTLAAVKKFQSDNKLTADGIVGNNTWGALTKVEAPAPSTPTTPAATTPSTGTASTKTPSTWSYDPFKVSDSTAAADKQRQDLASQKPGDFSYGDYEKSDIVKQAEALLQQQLSNKPGEYQSQWQTQLDDTLNKILNREKFSYDLNGDALYQQYKDQYMLQGQQAMMDTMGQAQAMTGGYGNSYAQTVGQQTYQGYLQQLNDRVPELYQLALNQYNREGEDLYNQYGLYADRENLDYGRYRDTVSDYNTELDRLTNDARYQSETDYSRYMDAYNMAYGQHRDSVSDWQQSLDRADAEYWNQYNSDYGQYSGDRSLSYDNYWNQQNLAYQKERDQKSDEQWQAEFDEAKRQYDQQYELAAEKSAKGTTGGSDTVYDTSDKGSSNYDNKGYSEEAIKRAQSLVGTKVDGKWGPQSQAALKAAGYESLEQVMVENGFLDETPVKPKTVVPTETANTTKFINSMMTKEEFISRGGTAKTYPDYVRDKLNTWYVKNGKLNDDEAAFIMVEYGL